MEIFKPYDVPGAINVVVGHYGSGKTEISLALAINAAAKGVKATVADLDIVNPFFRSAEKTDYLKSRSVDMVAPPYALTGVDLPVLSANVDAMFFRDDEYRVIDVGGDDAGAAALGRFRPLFEGKRFEVFYAVNAFRPYSSTVEQVKDMLGRIELRSRLKVTSLINNSNLADETSVDDVVKGYDFLLRVSEATGLKIACTCCLKRLEATLPRRVGPFLAIDRLLKPDWLD